MRISVELSMYSLSSEYKTHVRSFVERLRKNDGIEVRVNGMSTQVFGEFDLVMSAITKEIKESMNTNTPLAFVSKILAADVSGYNFDK